MKPSYEELEAQTKQLKIDADCYKKGMEASNARLVQLAAENAALKSKAAELVHEASEVYSAYNATITEPDGDFMDMQTLQEMQCVETTATDAFLAEVRASALPVEIAEIIDSGDLEAILFTYGHSETERYRMALYNLRTSRKGVQS
ncbi:hypothetical protein [Citrobacter sp. RHB21-C01]|uniref:hypothetical protein n=1 Tax=Citrobacter sp. RHB21-C01 TaxID=2742622 RepID=UPI0034D759C2